VETGEDDDKGTGETDQCGDDACRRRQ
jgi:hypothetical protein